MTPEKKERIYQALADRSFPAGTRVKLSSEGLRHLATLKNHDAETRATVVGQARDKGCINVRRDGRASTERYSEVFWVKAD